MTQVAKALERLRPWLPLRENASFSGAFDAIYSGAHADVVTLWQDALFREQKFEEQKQSLDEEWGAQAKDTQRRFFDPLYEKVRELEAEKAQLEATLAREERKTKALSEKVDEWFASAKHWQEKAEAAEQDRNEARKALLEKEDEAIRECHAAYRDRDDWRDKANSASEGMRKAVARAEQAEKRRDDWERSYDALLEVQNKDELTVTKHDIEKAVAKFRIGEESEEDFIRPTTRVSAITEAVWEELGVDDPPALVERESELPEVERDEDGDWIVDGGFIAASQTTAETVRGWIPAYLRSATCLEAVARAIEAEQAKDPEPDPVEAAIRSGLSVWGTTDRAVAEIAESVRHVLRQEASSDE